MFSGFPDTRVGTKLAAPIAEHQLTSDVGPVMALSFPTVETVRIDIQAALRIAKHGTDSGNRVAAGTITGMQIGTVAEVTGAVPFIQPADESDDAKEQAKKDHNKLVAELGACGFDPFPIGRYWSAANSQHLSSRQLSHLEACVRAGEPSVVVVYDPSRSALGKLYLKAFVLSDDYLRLMAEEHEAAKQPAAAAAPAAEAKPDGEGDELATDFRQKALEGNGLVKEVPVEIYASALQQQLLATLAQRPRDVRNAVIASHDLGRYMERCLTSTNDVLERLRNDVVYRQSKHRQEGFTPLRAETHMLMQQLKDQAQHLNAIAAGSALNLDFARQVAGTHDE